MAKRKGKKGKKSHSRRSGIRGFGSVTSTVTPLVAMIVGAVAGKFVTNKALPSTMNPTLKSAIPLVAGVGLMMMDKKNGMLSDAGKGMAVIGGLSLAQAFVPGLEGITEADITGIEEDITVGEISEIGDITIGDTVLEGNSDFD